MPTIAEPVDMEQREGKTLSLIQYYQRGMLGEATMRASLRILRYEPEEIRRIMTEAERSKR